MTRGTKGRTKRRTKVPPGRAGGRAFRSVRAKLREARVARLTTIGAEDSPHAVPVCFVYHRGLFYSPIDRKPKRVAPKKLARLWNIARKPQVALLIDHYEEDWTKLWFVLIRGKAQRVAESGPERREVLRALRKKYPQYAAGMLADDAVLLRITPRHAFAWGNTKPGS